MSSIRELLAPRQSTDVDRWWSGLVITALFAAPYGAAMGAWHGYPLMLYTAVKLPIVLLATLGLTLPFGWLLARIRGLSMGFTQALSLTTRPLAIASVVLASLAPIALLFTWSAGLPSEAARTTHNVLYLSHTTLVGTAALVGTRALWVGLARYERSVERRRHVYFVWLLIYAFVGGEVAWAMRPFVGSVYVPIVFLRDDALDGNVYEFILREILPHLVANNIFNSP